jgi:hypothetical protein
VVPLNQPPETDEDARFPITEAFKDCRGRTRQFEISMHVTDGGYFLRAVEVGKKVGGYQFQAYHPSSPWLALGVLRQKIPEGLATRYLVKEGNRRSLVHLRAVGHVGYDCVVIDGEEVSFHELAEMLQTYEGWHFELRITDGAGFF